MIVLECLRRKMTSIENFVQLIKPAPDSFIPLCLFRFTATSKYLVHSLVEIAGTRRTSDTRISEENSNLPVDTGEPFKKDG